MLWSPAGPTSTPTESLARMQNTLPSAEEPNRRAWLFYEISASEPRTVIGSCALTPKDRTGGKGSWELAYSMLPDYIGKGYATEGCRAAVESVMEQFRDGDATEGGDQGEGEGKEQGGGGEGEKGKGEKKSKKITAWVGPTNWPSIRVVEKLGMMRVKHQLFPGEPAVWVGGEWRDDGIYVYEKEF